MLESILIFLITIFALITRFGKNDNVHSSIKSGSKKI